MTLVIELQTSQVGLELAEKSARVTELEDFLSLRDKEMKQLQDKLREVVCITLACQFHILSHSLSVIHT